ARRRLRSLSCRQHPALGTGVPPRYGELCRGRRVGQIEAEFRFSRAAPKCRQSKTSCKAALLIRLKVSGGKDKDRLVDPQGPGLRQHMAKKMCSLGPRTTLDVAQHGRRVLR